MPKVSMTVHYTVSVKLNIPVEVDDTGDEIAMRHQALDFGDQKFEQIPLDQWAAMLHNPDFITIESYTTRR